MDDSILIVEPDEKRLAELSKQISISFGLKSLAAQNPADGLNLALSESPCLLLLHLSIQASTDLLNELTQAKSAIFTILMVDQESEQIPVELLRLGVCDYVSSPFSPQEISQTVSRILDQSPNSAGNRQLAGDLEKINRDLEKRLHEFDVLFKIGRSLNALLDLDAILNRVTEAAVFISGAEEGYLLLLDDETSELYLRAAQNLGEKYARGFRLQVSDSIAGSVVRSGKPILLGDDDQSYKIKTGYLVKALLNVPLKVGDRVIGVLGIDNQISSTPFTHMHLNQLTMLADIAAIALENARQYTELRQKLSRQIKEFATLQAIGGQLGAVTDFEMRARLALSLILNTVNAEAGVLAWGDYEKKQSPRYVSQGTLDELVFNDRGESNAWWNEQSLQGVIKTGQPVIKNNFDNGGCNGNGNGHGIKATRSQLAVPMRRGKQIIGAINLESSSPHIFTQGDLHFVSSVANQVAIALEGTLLQEKAEIDREYLSMLMSAVDDAVWLVDTELNIITQNEAASAIAGCTPAEAIGCSIFELSFVDKYSLQKLSQLLTQAIDERQPVVVDHDVLLAAQADQPIFSGGKVVPIVRGNQTVGALCAFHRVPADKRDKYVQLEFANMAAHLLRTPLGFIQTSVDLLLNSDLEPEEQRTLLSRMWERSHHLTEFTDELLDILRLETGNVRAYIEPVTLTPLVECVLNLMQSNGSQHQFTLDIPDTSPVVVADGAKTELVLFNLLTNAVNRSPDGGEITVKIEERATEIHTSVIDHGEPVPPPLQDRIFRQYYPVDDGNGKMPSTYQLGLYTTKRLIELQNGRVWIENQPGHRTRFSFSLPVWEK